MKVGKLSPEELRERRNKRQREKYAQNKDVRRQQYRERYAKNRDVKKQQRRANYAKNQEHERQRVRLKAAQDREGARKRAKIHYLKTRGRRNQGTPTIQQQQSVNVNGGDDLSVDIDDSVNQARTVDQHTLVEMESHQACVCLICDRFIIGMEKLNHIKKDHVLAHNSRLSVESYENHYGYTLHPDLVQQYSVHDLPGLLLSPRSRRIGDTFHACQTCMNGMAASRLLSEGPPKHAIANGFVIGHIPRIITTANDTGEDEHTEINEANLTDVLCSFLSPVRAYGFIFAYSGGAHKSVRGHFSFYEVNHAHVGGVMHYYNSTGANPNVYVVLAGRMTLKQKDIAKERARLDTQLLCKLLTWFITKSGHKGYTNLAPPSECPTPTVIEDPQNEHNTDEECNPEVEHHYAGATFHFASGHNPDEDTGVYGSTQRFIHAMLKRTMPTLLVQGGDYANLRELSIENVCVVQFPYGLGGPKMDRRTKISARECYKHYC